ncbi:MAG: hypothetical protein LBL57_10945 [Tannerella sp.]|jgi:hypothetical protein|nr:hypothetical protein [Tannerella sp.]
MNNVFLKCVFFCAVVSLMATCQKEEGEDNDLPSVYDQEVEAAKQWFENRLSAPSLKMSDGSVLSELAPDWDKAIKNSTNWEKTVEVELFAKEQSGEQSRGQVIFAFPENTKKYQETGDPRYLASSTRLVIKTHKRKKTRKAYLMTIMPSVECIEHSGFNPFRNMSYFSRDKHFSGSINFRTIDGILVNGWVYKHGKVTQSIMNKPAETDHEPTIEKESPQIKRLCKECEWVEVDVYQEIYCWDWIWDPDLKSTVYGLVVCDYFYRGKELQYKCYWVPLCFSGGGTESECECSPDSECMIESSDGSYYCDYGICFSLYGNLGGEEPWW